MIFSSRSQHAQPQAHGSLAAGFGDRRAAVPPRVVTVRQVHGADVAVVDDLEPGEHAEVAADALIVTRPGVLAAVKTADCVPILLLAAQGSDRWAAAVHAGWRGTAADVAGAAVADAVSRGHAPATLSAAIGPSIGPCCYEVGNEVAERFRALGLGVIDGGVKPHVDLRQSNRALLIRAGLEPGEIELCAPCTRCEHDRFHSYRADPAGRGRQLSWIGWTRHACA